MNSPKPSVSDNEPQSPFRYQHFIPRYAGFCPCLVDRIGRGYSKTTREVIQEQPLVGTRLSFLPETWRPSGQSVTQTDYRDDSLESNFLNHHCTGAPRVPEFVVGYTGHIPTNLRTLCNECYGMTLHVRPESCPDCVKRNVVHPPQTVVDGSVVTPRTVRGNKKCSCPYGCTCRDGGKNWIQQCNCDADRAKIDADVQNSRGREDNGRTAASSPRTFKNSSCQVPDRIRFNHIGFPREHGAIPHYTGFIPGSQWTVGESFGKISRQFLCNHEEYI